MQPTKTYTNKNETGCCPVPNVKDWNEKEIIWKNKKFIKDTSFNIFHMPLNMSSVMKRSWNKIQNAKASPPTEEWIMLSYDPSPWKGEHFLSVTREVPDAQNVTISGTFLTKVFEGPYKNAPKWVEDMTKFVINKKKTLKKLYFFYTTCPKCAKYYGKNYVVAFAQI